MAYLIAMKSSRFPGWRLGDDQTQLTFLSLDGSRLTDVTIEALRNRSCFVHPNAYQADKTLVHHINEISRKPTDDRGFHLEYKRSLIQRMQAAFLISIS